LTITDAYVADFIENYDPKHGDPDAAAEWLDSGAIGWRERYEDAWRYQVLATHQNHKS
jgi:hypothetical protein